MRRSVDVRRVENGLQWLTVRIDLGRAVQAESWKYETRSVTGVERKQTVWSGSDS